MAPPTARAYRADCPHCGASVAFASAASVSAVCSYCRSTLVRDGEALQRIGVSAELFDDHSRLQLGVRGRLQGEAFTLVGRLQMAYAEGTWNEWHALFDHGRSGWLSEDNGAYVFSFEPPAPDDRPEPSALQPGSRTLADGRAWDVASVVRARVGAAEGELPHPPRLQGEFTVADLRNAQGEVATVDDADPARRSWSIGRSVLLAELSLSGLREVAEKTLGARGVGCPSCGTALEIHLAATQSISCPQCASVVDVSAAAGGALAQLPHFRQGRRGPERLEPQLPLGGTGTLALGGPALPWQIVGYLERCSIPDPHDPEDEASYWREYLLHHPEAGFVFLVDADDGWSWVRPITGVPSVKGERARWDGQDYQRKWRYRAKVTWVMGEFYWRIRRDEIAAVEDWHSTGLAGTGRLSREQTPQEVTWSAGRTLTGAAVAEGFGLTPAQRAALSRDVSPLTSRPTSGLSVSQIVTIMVVVSVVLMLTDCDSDIEDCDGLRQVFGATSAEYRQCLQRGGGSGSRGGAWGGYSSGGGHK